MARQTSFRLSPEQARRLAGAPVGHLATSGNAGTPHVIPVCFVLEQGSEGPVIYIVLDQKPKRASPARLRRVRNILENPQASLLVDHYEADWTKLWYILLTGTAQLLEADSTRRSREGGNFAPAHPEPVEGREPAIPAHPEPVEGREPAAPAHPEPVEGRHAIRLLRHKYPQYREMDLDGNPVIKVTVQRAVSWSYTPEPDA